jgi:N-acyl homoserine lactone hydrolase
VRGKHAPPCVQRVTLSRYPEYVYSALGRFLLRKIFRLHIGAEDALAAQLARRCVDPSEIRTVVISHTHFDHVGGISAVRQARLLLSEAEWAHAVSSDAEKNWVLRRHLALSTANWQPIEFEPPKEQCLEHFAGAYDLEGDGSMVLLPTPGHTPGSVSLLLRSANMRPVLLIGDLSYSAEQLMNDEMPGRGDRRALKQSYAKVEALTQKLPDLLIVPSHDDVAQSQLAGVFQGAADSSHSVRAEKRDSA